MAGKTLEYDLKVLDKSKSMQQRTKDAKEYNNELSRSEKLMQQSRRAAYKQESVDYGATRALAMGTGASGRDFAKEAQGLGGLVRLYATFAANIFAVTAAFQQLSKAMDTTNMVQGMNQLSALSGVALTNVSKNLVRATDGAISLREAMEATAMATSAGLNVKQIEDIGTIAKSVSLALGRDMTDSITRLTRGIVKLEPELLDELGLFTKIGPATEKYALSVGKSVTQLTDFERRQAFANAVITEGLDKFSQIRLQANPYSKLLASLKDVAQAGLELVNKVLTPIIEILSQSPTALGAILAGIAVTLTKQALPAIANFNKSMRDSAAEAVEAATRRAVEVDKILKREVANRKAAADAGAEAESMRWEKTSQVLEALAKDRAQKIAKASRSGEGTAVARDILGKSVAEITSKDLATLDELGKRQTKVAVLYRDLAQAKRDYDREAENYEKGRQAAEKYYASQQSLITTTGRLLYQAQEENQRARSQEITANAAATTSTLGLRAALSQLFTEIGKARAGDLVKTIEVLDAQGKKTGETVQYTIERMGAFRAALTGVSGAVKIFTTYAANLVSFFGIWGQAFALAGLVVGGLYNYFAKATDALEKFDEKIDKNKANIKVYSDSLEAISKKDPAQVFSVQSLTAQANAVEGLAQSLSQLRTAAISAFDTLERKGNVFEKIVEGWKSAFGKGIGDQFRTELTKSIEAQVKGLDRSPLNKELIENYGRILDVQAPVANLDKLLAAIDKLPLKGARIKLLVDTQEEYSKKLKESSRIQEVFKENIKKTDEDFKKFITQYNIDDPFTRFVISATKSLGDLQLAIDQPITQSIENLIEALNRLNSTPLFDQKDMAVLEQARIDLVGYNKQLGDQSKYLDELRQKRIEIQEKVGTNPFIKDGQFVGRTDIRTKASEEAKNLLAESVGINQRIAQAEDTFRSIEQKAANASRVVANAIPSALDQYTGRFASILSAQLAKGATTYLQALYQRTTELVPESARDVAQLKNKELSSELSLIKAMESLAATMRLNDVNAREREIDRQIEDKKNTETLSQAFYELATRLSPGSATAQAQAASLNKIQVERTALEDRKSKIQTEKDILAQIRRDPVAGFRATAGKGLDAAAIANAQEAAVAQTGFNAKKTQIANQQNLNTLEGEEKVRESIQGLEQRRLELEGRRRALNTENLGLLREFNLISIDQYENSVVALKNAEIENELTKIRSKTAFDVTKADALSVELIKQGKQGLADQLTTQARLWKIAEDENAERDAGIKKAKVLADIYKAQAERAYEVYSIQRNLTIELAKIDRQTVQERLSINEQIFNIEKERGRFTDEEVRQLEKSFAITRANLDFEGKRADILDDLVKKEEDLNKERVSKGMTDEEYNARLVQITSLGAAELKNAQVAKDGRMKIIETQNNLTTAQKSYLNLLTESVERLQDLFVTFAQTGKFEFKNFINSILLDMLKLELKMRVFQPLRASLSSLFFPGIPVTGAASKGAMFTANSAYFSNVDKYAQGGLINSPTVFKHSGGPKLAMAGEAGPEFIMPAFRTTSGDLGVRAVGSGGGKTEINIYNNTQANVEAKETVDSRGNRSFDVIISEMVAGNMAQPGSSMQNSLRGNYGLSPALVRR
jgi:hypothetical protein